MELECFEHSFGILGLIPDDLDPQMIIIYDIFIFWFLTVTLFKLKIWPLHFLNLKIFYQKNKTQAFYFDTTSVGGISDPKRQRP